MKTLSHIAVALLLVFLFGNASFADYSAVRARRNAGFGCRTFKPRRAIHNLNRYQYYPLRYNNQSFRLQQSSTMKRTVIQYPKTAAERQAMYTKAQKERFNRQRTHRARFNGQ